MVQWRVVAGAERRWAPGVRAPEAGDG